YTRAARAHGVPMPDPDRAGQVFFRTAHGAMRSIPLGKFDATTIELLVQRAARGAQDPFGLDAETIAREEKDAPKPGIGSVNVAPRWLIGLSMAVLAPAYALAAAHVTSLHAQGAGNAVAQIYFRCADQIDNLTPAGRAACRRQAETDGLPLIAARADQHARE